MLNLCGAKWEPRFVDFFNGETRTPEYREINEMGEVPVLEHRGKRFTQSGVILHYLADHFGKFQGEGSRCCAGSYGTTTSSRATSPPAVFHSPAKVGETQVTNSCADG